MSKIWFISDTHFGDSSIKEKCKRPSNWENLLFKNIKDKVSKEDTLIHLGDVGVLNYNCKESLFKSIKCKNKILVLGNHDDCLFEIKRQCGFTKVFERGSKPFIIEDVDNLGIKIAIRLSHEPMIFDEEIKRVINDNDLIQEPVPVLLNIHGHLHNLAKIKSVFPHFNVSIEEIGYSPICLDEILFNMREDILSYYNKLIKLKMI